MRESIDSFSGMILDYAWGTCQKSKRTDPISAIFSQDRAPGHLREAWHALADSVPPSQWRMFSNPSRRDRARAVALLRVVANLPRVEKSTEQEEVAA